MKLQNPSFNFFLNGRTNKRTNGQTNRKQYAPHFFKVGGIKSLGDFGRIGGLVDCDDWDCYGNLPHETVMTGQQILHHDSGTKVLETLAG